VIPSVTSFAFIINRPLFDGLSVRIINGRVKNKITLDANIFCPYDIRYMKKRGRPKLPVGSLKGEYMEMRLDVAEKKAFVRAAELAGMSLSGWVRDRLRRASRKELEDMNMPVAFLDRLSA